MKNGRLSVLVCMMAIIALGFGFVACGGGNGETIHEHQWGNWIQTTAPTCETTGIETRTCSLDSTHTETRTGANALGHNWNGWEISTISISKKTCSRCTEKINGEIGDTGPSGGKIFYLSEAGFTMTDDNSIAHYLEAAPIDQTRFLLWATSGFETEIGANGEAIGTGRKNTNIITAARTPTETPAAWECRNANHGGLNDWFLPSKDEIKELQAVGTVAGIGYGCEYWTSTETGTNAIIHDIFANINRPIAKNTEGLDTRAVRAF